MAARILDGKEVAAAVRRQVAADAARIRQQHGRPPGLAAVLVGDDPASHVYVRNKRRACEKVGIASWLHQLPGTATTADVLALIGRLNRADDVDGILVQLPLPNGIDQRAVIDAIDPAKDVDGFHPHNYGLLAAGRPRFVPCTPLGIQRLLQYYDIPIAGRHVVIVGRSNLVGRPLALLLLRKGEGGDATVTVCHSRTRELARITRAADIVVVAIGRAGFLRADMVSPGAVVIDVGINRFDGRLVGDVAYEEVAAVAGAITPVPGGVGPMTVAMLLANTVMAAEWRLNGR